MGTRLARPVRRIATSGLAAALLALVGCDLGASPTTYAAPGRVVAVADVQGDGHLDVVTWSDNEYGILTNDSTGAFTVTTVAHPSCSIGMSPDEYSDCSVTFADANTDGAVDMLVTLVSDISPPPLDPLMHTDVLLSLNDGSGTFGTWTSVAGADGDRDGRIPAPRATFGDVTGDGTVDIVFADFPFLATRRIQVLPGDGTGSFGSAIVSTNPPPFIDSYPQVVDLDADGNGDLLFGGSCFDISADGTEGYERGCVDVMLGDGSGTFTAGSHSLVEDPVVDRSVAQVGDVDSDGDLDVVTGDTSDSCCGSVPVGSLTVFLNDGTGALGPGLSQPATTQTVDVALGEFDGDGHPDILTSSDTADGKDWHHVLFGDGTGAFSGNHLLPTGPGQVGDFDGDGRSDYVVTTSAGTQVFLNRWNGRPV